MHREILIRTGDGKSRLIPLLGDRISIGRSGSNDLVFADDVGLSRRHLVLERDGEDWAVEDLGSKNGTQVNGEPVSQRRRLRPGDRITAGRLVILYDDPLGGAPESVVFVESPLADTPVSTTIVARVDPARGPDAGAGGAGTSFAGADRRVQALIRAGRELAGHRPLADLFPLILQLAMEAVQAQRGVLLTLEREQLLVRAACGASFRISTAVRDRVLRERASLLVRDALSDEALRGRLSIQQQRVRGMMAAPLETEGRVIGLIYVDTPNPSQGFTPEDLDLLAVMANVAAIRLEHARLAEVEQSERMLARELERAAEIQRKLLPEKPPKVEGVELAGYNAPCRTVGGDYYDFLPLDGGRLGLVVADVSGKGMPAALLMSNLQARIQVLAEDPSDLAALLERLNRLLRSSSPPHCFVSLFFGVLDPSSGELVYANAGHNPALLVRTEGRAEWLESGGPVLGILPTVSCEPQRCQLRPGDVLVLYSDGVTEAADPSGVEFGSERLAELCLRHAHLPPSGLLEELRGCLRQWLGARPAEDDITLVAVKR